MNFIIAIINPHSLNDVQEALNEIGVSGMTVTEVKGYGRQKGHTEIYRGSEYAVDFIPKIRLEVAIESQMTDSVVEAIKLSASSGKIGDGKVFVLPLNQILRIRTGEVNHDAI